jgi:hypothetical protein
VEAAGAVLVSADGLDSTAPLSVDAVVSVINQVVYLKYFC